MTNTKSTDIKPEGPPISPDKIKSEPKYHFDEDRPVPAEKKSLNKHPAFTEGTKRKILLVLQAGLPANIAARHAGIHPNTLHRWLKIGEMAGPDATGYEGKFYEFYLQCMDAHAKNAIAITSQLYKHAKDDPKTAQFIATKLHPDIYGDHKRVTVSGPGGGPIEVEQTDIKVQLQKLSDEDLDKLAALYKKSVFEEEKEKALDAGDIIDAEFVEEDE